MDLKSVEEQADGRRFQLAVGSREGGFVISGGNTCVGWTHRYPCRYTALPDIVLQTWGNIYMARDNCKKVNVGCES